MKGQTAFACEQSASDADLINRLIGKADQILVKKLSNNDRDWSRFENKHQGGVYIQHEVRDSNFFPNLELKHRRDGKTDEIWERFFRTDWPQVNELNKKTRLVNYRSKGQETHMTGLPKSAFADLLPASLLVIGRIQDDKEAHFECITLDSDSDEVALLSDIFDIDPDFLIGIFKPSELKSAELDRIMNFAEKAISAWLDGNIEQFAAMNAVMPVTYELAALARKSFMKMHDLEMLDPFKMEAPGDALREISRKIEWDLFREYQRKERSVELVRMVMGDKPKKINASEVIRRLIDRLPEIDALMLSASQQRKSRAGYSYEHHIEAMLTDGDVPFEKQVILTSKKRPDFILPSLSFIDGNNESATTGLILSAKTTLRERWKQVEREMEGRQLYLTTVDENISKSTIEEMASCNVNLVIPESLRKSKETEYDGHANVLSFREFSMNVIAPSLSWWQTE